MAEAADVPLCDRKPDVQAPRITARSGGQRGLDRPSQDLELCPPANVACPRDKRRRMSADVREWW